MEEALQRSQDNSHSPDLKVSVLLDYTRGSRGSWRFPWDLYMHLVNAEPLAHRPDCICVTAFHMQGRLTRGPCCSLCCSASHLRCGCLCTTLQTWGGCCGCWSRSASTRPSESSTSKSICLTTASSSAGMPVPVWSFLHLPAFTLVVINLHEVLCRWLVEWHRNVLRAHFVSQYLRETASRRSTLANTWNIWKGCMFSVLWILRRRRGGSWCLLSFQSSVFLVGASLSTLLCNVNSPSNIQGYNSLELFILVIFPQWVWFNQNSFYFIHFV